MYYTAFGIVTPVGGRPVHRLREEESVLFLLIIKMKINEMKIMKMKINVITGI